MRRKKNKNTSYTKNVRQEKVASVRDNWRFGDDRAIKSHMFPIFFSIHMIDIYMIYIHTHMGNGLCDI